MDTTTPATPATPAATPDTVRAVHDRRRGEAETALAAALRVDARIANARLLVFAAGLAVALGAGAADAVSWGFLALPLAGFVLLVVFHARAARAAGDARRLIGFHQHALARLGGTWPGSGPDGARFADPEHPYCDHLDVFGKGSLFQLISLARTPQGEARLAEWLKGPAPRDEIAARQQAVRELAPRLDLREDAALLGADAATAQGLAGLTAWGTAPSSLAAPWLPMLALVASMPSLVALVGWISGVSSGWLVLLGFAITRAIVAPFGKPTAGVLEAVEAPARDLRVLRGLLVRIEGEHFEAPPLADVLADLRAGGGRASGRIADLERRIAFADAMRNPFFAPFALALAWDLHAALRLEAWRTRTGPALGTWIDAAARFEALASLAGYAALHPEDPFPEIVDGPPSFVATAAAHPLLRVDQAVRNDVTIDATRRVHVVSGSNMSGKSTLLRTVGANAVLALAGAPVRAEALRLSRVTIGASIHVHDSLLDGESRFYAEVARIGRIVRLGQDGPLPLLFLLDEIFHGTNSADRRTGAAAVVRELLAEGSTGLITTHDLELARIAEDLDEHVVNVHFEDQFEDGRMTFDYRMRPGVVTRSNALALMRAVGLDV